MERIPLFIEQVYNRKRVHSGTDTTFDIRLAIQYSSQKISITLYPSLITGKRKVEGQKKRNHILMKYYPINLNIKGKKCLVTGGGKVAERKILSLLACEAEITVISPKITKQIKKLSSESKISLVKRNFRKGDLKGVSIVIAATNNSKTNQEILREANKKKLLVNVVDSPQLCNFTMPSLIRRGDLLLTISTSGKAPALSKKLRIMLEEVIGDEYELILDKLSDFRNGLKAKAPSERKRKEMLEERIDREVSRMSKKIFKIDGTPLPRNKE